jgi:2-phospho-L-lactate guanylyltransferase (CobY/MobA/RfbA family)
MLVDLNPNKVCFLIIKIREFDIQINENEGGGSNASDDDFAVAYNEQPHGSVLKEVEQFIRAMDVDEKRELVALTLTGRGEFTAEEWNEAMKAAASRPELSSVKVLLENPALSDELEEGLEMFGLSCDDFDEKRL